MNIINILKRNFAPSFIVPNKVLRICNMKTDGFLTKFKKYKAIVDLENEYHICLGNYCKIGGGLKLLHPMNITIGDNAIIGNDVTIYQNVTIGKKDILSKSNNDDYPVIENGVIISAGAVSIGNVHIGKNAIIGANAVVTHDVADGMIVVGVPAHEIGKE